MGECLHKKFAADLTKKKRNGKVRVCIFLEGAAANAAASDDGDELCVCVCETVKKVA